MSPPPAPHPDSPPAETSGFRWEARHAVAGWTKSPGLALSVLLTLALAVGAGAPVLGAVRAGRARTVPYLDPLLHGTERLPGWLTAWTPGATLVSRVQDAAFRTLLSIVLVLTLLLLGSALVNVLTLLLSRAAVRRPEVALRAVLGASRRRLGAQLLGEASLLVLPGIVLGVAGAALGAWLLNTSWPVDRAPWARPLLHGGILGAVAVALAGAALGAWMSPVRLAWKVDLRRHLDSGGRATATKGEVLLRNALAVIQLGASLVLLSLAGVLYHSFTRAPDGRALGYDPRGALTARIDLPVGYTPPRRARAWDELLWRVGAVPGVRAAGAATAGAWVGLGTTDQVVSVCPECFEGGFSKPVSTGLARIHAVSPGFFRALGVPIVRGREFGPGDRAGAPRVVVINTTFAYRLFPAGEPLGKLVQVGGHGVELYQAFRSGGVFAAGQGAAEAPDSVGGDWYRVVGIVGEVRGGGIGVGPEPAPVAYVAAPQRPPSAAGLVVRVDGDPRAIAPAVERAVRGAEPRAGWGEAMSMDEYLARFRAPLKWFAELFGVLAAVVLVVAASGLYGVMVYNVERRTREIGIRMALGARPRQVVRMVVGQSLKLACIGAGAGLIAVGSLARLLQEMLFGVDLWDPALYGGLAAVLAAVAVAASVRPARRAASLDPGVALRSE
ncbi:FtsX-like permease family protein [Longimicrobium sp.]|uniref:FtsX-like permease family protein n=1 Tax=Longimicrobium sp. TaxID=2029185 RepID=UPI002C0CA708|nr:FtsX-like permease family protein [Longimicrobium sp.]HSU17057.1 FtsX-like permease family protein [Longimicrobium sp.]